jgi:Protein of unknown function (DUF1552)
MKSYRASRRAFLAGVGGALGLQAMLRNLEAAAAGLPPPPRFVLAQWPFGTLSYAFRPSAPGFDYAFSPILTPFEAAGLREDMTVFFGLSDGRLRCPGAAGTEQGTVFMTTGCDGLGTRKNGDVAGDAIAGGPSFDQVFLRRVPLLSGASVPSVSVSCEARVDTFEVSTQCLSYDYRTVPVVSNQLQTVEGNVPLMPELSPYRLYARLFSGFMPGGATPANQLSALTTLALRKSVLDSALTELRELRRLAPASESQKLDAHAEAIRSMENRLSPLGETCTAPPPPDATLSANSGSVNAYSDAAADESAHVLSVTEAHQAVLTAALQCDLTRVATLQLAAGSASIAFGGLWPGDPERVVRHRVAAMSGTMNTGGAVANPETLNSANRERYEFLTAVQAWYNTRLASWLTRLKESRDVFGGSLLDYTVVPFVTEIAQPNKGTSNKPACLFGGRKLGIKHGSYQEFSVSRPHVDLYLTCAQALLGSASPLEQLAGERFLEFNPGAAPIAGLWEAPQ